MVGSINLVWCQGGAWKTNRIHVFFQKGPLVPERFLFCLSEFFVDARWCLGQDDYFIPAFCCEEPFKKEHIEARQLFVDHPNQNFVVSPLCGTLFVERRIYFAQCTLHYVRIRVIVCARVHFRVCCQALPN